MGGTQRLAAIAAISHARHYYNLTQPEVVQTEASQYGVNVFFVSATLCGVLVVVCAACWPRAPALDKPDDARSRAIYTVSDDVTRATQRQIQEDLPEPPPAYDMVVIDVTSGDKDAHILQEVVTEPCGHCPESPERPDSGLPSYETAVMLKESKL